MGLSFYCDFCVPDDVTVVQFGSQNLTIPIGSLKFSFGVDNWPFIASNNGLQFVIQLILKDGEGKSINFSDRVLSESSYSFERIYQFSLSRTTGLFRFPFYAIIDGQEVSMTATQVTNGNILTFNFQFPHFNTSLAYDPVVAFAGDISTPSSSSSSSSSLSSLSPLSLALLPSILIAFLNLFFHFSSFGFFFLLLGCGLWFAGSN